MKSRLTALALAMALAGAVAVLLTGAGCGASEETAAELDGSSWRLSGWSLSSLDPSDFTITAEFAGGGVGGTSAVNTYRGSYETGADGAFSVSEIASTMMAGPEPDMRAEQAYIELLDGAASCALEGDTLTLFDEGGNESLIFSATGE